ncbi:MAG: hypothetical protein K2N12_04150, partial [Helicobacter sp.]|nr:hypothetical protein [Helicobacter sp.]
AKLKSIEQSTTGKEIATLEAKEKELSGKIAKLIKEMSGGAKKEEFTTLENGTIVFKDTLGKEHTISKEIQEQWTSTFGLKNIEESIEIALPDVVGEKIGKNIRINVGSLLKMVSQKREKYINELAEVLREPELVLGDDTILILARHLKDKDFFVNVSVDKGEYFASISNGIKEANNLRNKIQNGMEILYQSPNANSNLQTLLQASRYSANKTDKGNSTPQNIKGSLEKGETHESLQQQLQQVERELATNRERIDKAMPEDKPKLREIHRELLDQKKQIRAEIDKDKDIEILQNQKAEDRSEAMSANWELASDVGLERFLKLYDTKQQKAIRDFIDSVNERPDMEYIDKNGTINKVKKVLDTSTNSLKDTLRPEAQTTKDEVQYFILSDDKGQMSFRQLDINTLKKELKEAKTMRLRGKRIDSNMHIGSGILTGSVAGLETDEQGNISFSPEKFVLGFLAGAAGSKAISSALQHLANNPEHKKKAIDVIAQSLAKNVPDTLKKYPLLELVLPRKIST